LLDWKVSRVGAQSAGVLAADGYARSTELVAPGARQVSDLFATLAPGSFKFDELQQKGNRFMTSNTAMTG